MSYRLFIKVGTTLEADGATRRVTGVAYIRGETVPDTPPEGTYYFDTVPPDFLTAPWDYTVESGMLLYDPA